MIEILALRWLMAHVGDVLAHKGRSSGGYKMLAAVLWFVGEIIGFVIGMLLTGDTGLAAYVLAILGAAVGALIVNTVVEGVAPATSSE